MSKPSLNDITNHSTYKQVMRDSFGGIMYNVANFGKYDRAELLDLWEQLSPAEKGGAGGIVNGAINFLQGK